MTIFNRSLGSISIHIVMLLIVTILARCFKRLGGGILLSAVMGFYPVSFLSQIAERAGLDIVLRHDLVSLLPDV